MVKMQFISLKFITFILVLKQVKVLNQVMRCEDISPI